MNRYRIAYRRQQTRLEHLLLGCLLGSVTVASTPPWGTRSIAELELEPPERPFESTPSTPPPVILSPHRAALVRLIEMDATEGSEPNWQTPDQRRIAAMGDYREIDETTLEERIEASRLDVLMQSVEEDLRRGRTESANHQLLLFLETARYDRTRTHALQRLGVIAFRQQEYAQAATYMEAAWALEPHNAALASNLAAAQMTLGRLDEALHTLSAIPLGFIRSPQLLFSIHFNLACLYSMKGQVDAALDHLYQAAERDAPSAFTSLGDPQLDGIRGHLRFRELQTRLEQALRQHR